METTHNEKVTMKTLVSCTNTLDKLGFTTQFKALAEGLKSLTSETLFSASEVKIINFYRFEGESDPADNVILYALETSNGEKGTLTDAFGPYSDTNITAFMTEVENMGKKVDRDKKLCEDPNEDCNEEK